MFRRIIAPPLAVLCLLLLAACGPKVHVSDEGRVPGASASDDLVRLINLQRSKAGLAPLEADSRLARAADDHAAAMAGTVCVDFDCGGRKTDARLSEAGYRAQNSRFYVSAGHATAEEMIREMMSADWGRDMVLSPAFRNVAAAHAANGSLYRHYWAIGFAAPAVEDLDALAAEVLRLVNIERGKAGAGPLALNDKLNRSAQYHADFMAENDCFEHLCPNEGNLGKRVRDSGYEWRAVAENIAAGHEDPAEVMDSWMNSPGHRANILNPRYKELGVGYVLLDRDGGKVDMRHYWVQNFGAQ